MTVKIGIFSRTRVIDKISNQAISQLYTNPPREVIELRQAAKAAARDHADLTKQLAMQVLSAEELSWAVGFTNYLSDLVKNRLVNDYNWYRVTINGFEDEYYAQSLWQLLASMQNQACELERSAIRKLNEHRNKIEKDARYRIDHAFKSVVKDEDFGLVVEAGSPLHVGIGVVDIDPLVEARIAI